MSSKMVSLHLPGEKCSLGKGSNRPAAGGATDVSSGSLTGDRLEGQQLDVFTARVGRAVVLG